MNIAIVGLGRMGANLARRLARSGHHVVGVNRTVQVARDLAEQEENIVAADDLQQAVAQLSPPRIVWIMVPSGDATEDVLHACLSLMDRGDVLIDGGNSNYHDTLRRSEKISEAGLTSLTLG